MKIGTLNEKEITLCHPNLYLQNNWAHPLEDLKTRFVSIIEHNIRKSEKSDENWHLK